jgi:hypothetical protein
MNKLDQINSKLCAWRAALDIHRLYGKSRVGLRVIEKNIKAMEARLISAHMELIETKIGVR